MDILKKKKTVLKNMLFTLTPDKFKLNCEIKLVLIFTVANFMYYLWKISFILDYMLWSKYTDKNEEIFNKLIRFQINLCNVHYQLILVFISKRFYRFHFKFTIVFNFWSRHVRSTVTCFPYTRILSLIWPQKVYELFTLRENFMLG